MSIDEKGIHQDTSSLHVGKEMSVSVSKSSHCISSQIKLLEKAYVPSRQRVLAFNDLVSTRISGEG